MDENGNMTLVIGIKVIGLNVQKVIDGFWELFEYDNDFRLPLSLGMINLQHSDLMEENLRKAIFKQFYKPDQDLFKTEIENFVKEVMKQVVIGLLKKGCNL